VNRFALVRRWSLGIRTISGSWSTTRSQVEGRLDAHKGYVQSAAEERLGEIRRIVARDRDVEVLQLVAQQCMAFGSQFIS